ncbi:MAG: hypothetical protein JJU45_15285 [Acidimicrobiia bacterium]|nr:hypothetical protein [Acidimicrobiia bacterium]
MIHFVLVAGRPSSVHPRVPVLAESIERTRFMDGVVRSERSPTGRWALCTIEMPDPLSDARCRTHGDTFALFNGPALGTSGRQGHLASQALDAVRRGGVDAVADTMVGTHNVVAHDPQSGLFAFTDFSGMYPLYWTAVEGGVVVGNRPSTVAAVAGRSGWDLLAFSWIIGHGNLFGDHLPHDGVRLLRPDLALRLDPADDTPRLERSPTNIWPGPGDPAGGDDLAPAEWDRVAERMVDDAAAIGDLGAPVTLMLSGGKDSRLCLALLLAAGVADSVRLLTTGGPDSPEVRAATEVARAAALPHFHLPPGKFRPQPIWQPPPRPAGAPEPWWEVQERQIRWVRPGATSLTPQPRTPWQEDMAEVWQRLRWSVYRYDAMACLWDGLAVDRLAPGTGLTVKGFGGEFYRTHQYVGGVLVDRAAMADRFVRFQQRPDPLGILTDDVAAAQEQWLRRWVDIASCGVRFDLLPDHFRIATRNTHWNGPMLQFKPASVQLNPLLSLTGARASMLLDPRERATERFHYEVMRRAAPQLVDVPFLDDQWSHALTTRCSASAAESNVATHPTPAKVSDFLRQHGLDSTRPASPRRPPPLPSGPSPLEQPTRTIHALKTWQWRFLGTQQEELVSLFRRAATDTAMADICDMDRLVAVAERAGSISEATHGKSVISAVGIALALLDEGEPTCDGPIDADGP